MSRIFYLKKSFNTILVRRNSHLKLYGFPLSQPTRSVALLLKENNIDFDMVHIDVFKGEHRKPEFKKINPTTLVPLIDDDGFYLSESGAILQYLAESRSLTNWYPIDVREKAKVNFWMHWMHTNVRVSTKGLLVNKTVLQKRAGADEAFASGFKSYTKSIEFLEKYLAEKCGLENTDSTYLVGSKPTLADLIILPEVDQVSQPAFGFFDYSSYPFVMKWMKLMQTSLKSYDEIFSPVIKIADNFKKTNI
eukprot:gene5619-7761_t